MYKVVTYTVTCMYGNAFIDLTCDDVKYKYF